MIQPFNLFALTAGENESDYYYERSFCSAKVRSSVTPEEQDRVCPIGCVRTTQLHCNLTYLEIIKDFNHLMMMMLLRADLTRYTRMARFGSSRSANRSGDKGNTCGAPSYQHSQSDGSMEDNDLTLLYKDFCALLKYHIDYCSE